MELFVASINKPYLLDSAKHLLYSGFLYLHISKDSVDCSGQTLGVLKIQSGEGASGLSFYLLCCHCVSLTLLNQYQFISLPYSCTSVLIINSFCKQATIEEAHTAVGWCRDSQVLVSAASGRQAPRAEAFFFFLVKRQQRPDLKSSEANK